MNTANHHGHPLPSTPTSLKKLAAKGQRARVTATTPTRASKVVARGESGSGKNRNHTSEGCDEEEDGEMASSFLQFCAMCEKQIVVPNNSMLYCSESCRRRDASKPPSNVPDNMYTPSSTPSSIPDSDAFGITTRAIVPRQKPSTYASTSSIPPVLHNAKSDLDPTEWKPDSVRHTDSEASKYLSQFHRSKSGSILPRRPVLQTHMAASMIPTVMAAPSLSHTPTTSSASSSSSIAGTPYEFITPSAHAPGLYITPPSTTEHNGISSSNSSASVPPTLKAVHGKGKAICAPVSPTLVGEVSYEKKWIAALSTEPVAMDGSLKKLLRYQEEGFADAM